MVLTEGPKEFFLAADPVDVASASGTNSAEKGNIGTFLFFSDDICSVILDVSFKRMLKTPATILPNSLELWSDELHGKNGFIQYHSRLVRFLLHLIALLQLVVCCLPLHVYHVLKLSQQSYHKSCLWWFLCLLSAECNDLIPPLS